MSIPYAQSKRLASLAKRYISDHDAHLENLDLNEHYNLELRNKIENLLIEKCGYKKEEPEIEIHRPRKVGTRPPKRTPGERPRRIGEKILPRANTGLSKPTKEINIEIPVNTQDMPDWKKKLWRKIMMAVHPDRIDAVSSSEKNKVVRVKIRETIQINNSDAMLIASGNILKIEMNLSAFEQERTIRAAIQELKTKNTAIFQSVPWLWGESFTNDTLRLEIIKAVLINNSLQPPSDEVILEFFSRKNK